VAAEAKIKTALDDAAEKKRIAEEGIARERLRERDPFMVGKTLLATPKDVMEYHKAHPATLNPLIDATNKYQSFRNVNSVQVAVPPSLKHMLGIAAKALQKAKKQVSNLHNRFDRLESSIQSNNRLIETEIVFMEF
jgi:hypothetical protein